MTTLRTSLVSLFFTLITSLCLYSVGNCVLFSWFNRVLLRSINVCVMTNWKHREREFCLMVWRIYDCFRGEAFFICLMLKPHVMGFIYHRVLRFYSFDANLMLKLHVMSFSIIVISDERVPTELKKAIMQARTDKKLTQSQLAQVLYLSFFSLYLSLLIITQFVT